MPVACATLTLAITCSRHRSYSYREITLPTELFSARCTSVDGSIGRQRTSQTSVVGRRVRLANRCAEILPAAAAFITGSLSVADDVERWQTANATIRDVPTRANVSVVRATRPLRPSSSPPSPPPRIRSERRGTVPVASPARASRAATGRGLGAGRLSDWARDASRRD